MAKKFLKFKFDQLHNGLLAFIANLEANIHEIVEIPVYMINSGDGTYWHEKKWIFLGEDKKREIYQKVPRLTLTFDETQLQTDQNSNQSVSMRYQLGDEFWMGEFRRQATIIPFRTDLVCSTIVEYLFYQEILISIFGFDKSFTFESHGKVLDGNYNSTGFSVEKPSMEVSSNSTNFVANTTIDLTLQLFTPNYKTLRPIRELATETVIQIDSKIADDPAMTDTTYIRKKRREQCD